MQAEEYHETVHQNPEDGKRHRLAHDVANVVVGTGIWGVRSGAFDLFPKDENKKRKSAASVSFLSLTLFEAINSENNLH